MKTMEIPDMNLEQNNWKPFFFDANMWSGRVNGMEQWNELRAAYPELSDDDLLAAKEATYQGTLPQEDRDLRPHYGFRWENDGERTLRDFFTQNGMDIEPRP